ncbi:MAG: hypothetical protein FWD05_12455 [Oscillospiraceae bacterium]|nr:hypothetical protein [Oscillospiraceae bacterium]
MINKPLHYSEFGAVGDGVTDDFDAIIHTHTKANELGLPVYADPNAVYYIGGADKTAIIQTDTDWNSAKFIIDDKSTENYKSSIFEVKSKLEPVRITDIQSIKKNQEQLDINLSYDSLVVAVDNTTKRFIREGLNVDNGSNQTDVFIISKDGYIDPNTAVIWDFDKITSLTAFPIDSEPLYLKGGIFTTVANHAEAKYTYFKRNIAINRSNTIIDGLTHHITDERSDHGAPYSGFIFIYNCADVTMQNCKMTAHRTYTTIGAASLPVKMGTYDILADEAVNLVFKDCTQLNDITDDTNWGIFSSNYTKNIVFDNVHFSRFDAHKGTTNPKILNSTIGHMGIKLIGSGTCLIENTTVKCDHFAHLRADYGSTWEGEIIIRNCEFAIRNDDFIPNDYVSTGPAVLWAEYSGLHDFGYKCFMPRKIVIDGLVINDEQASDDCTGPRIFSPIHDNYFDEHFEEKYPYALPEVVEIKGIKTKSGKPWTLSDNMSLFKDVKIVEN